MALVASLQPKSHDADPTAPLRQALMSLENILTEEQKQQYQASSTKPNASSVLAFVAEIDENNKGRASRCVAPRLYTFLDAAQQFTGVVDTFVSSNPTIAALVWGGVKTAVLTASNIASYFDKVTSMIMDIGQVCPTYQQFGQLYPGCVGLQHALCEYYAIIIRLCIKIIEISRRTAILQMLSSIFNPFEAEFKVFHDDLDRAAKLVQSQISLASKQAAQETARLLELESKENVEHRRLALKFHKDARKEHDEAHQWRIRRAKREVEKMRSAIRTNLSTINHVKPWKRAVQQRVPNTAEWFQHEHAFHDWRGDNHTAILWCSGTMGVGKTVLMSNMVAHLHMTGNQSDIISYYFCQPDLPESLRARNILGSLARQVLDNQIEHAKDDLLVSLHHNSQELDAADVIDFLIPHLEDDKTYYIILDGLDECGSGDIQDISQSLNRLCDSRMIDLKVLCSGRPELEKELFRIHQPRYKLKLTGRHTGPDIEQYITSTLDRCLEVDQLKLSDPTLVLTIANALQEGSDGMFLWARLIIEELCAKASDNDIIEALGHLPRGLSELLNQKFARVQGMQSAREAIKVLQWCGVTRKALTTEKFREVLSISPGQNSLDRGNLPNDMNRIIADCCGLVFVEEEESTVHYVHHSVRKHLFAEHGPHSGQFNEADVDKHFGYLCMTYLAFNDFKRQIAKVSGPLPDPIKIGVGAVAYPNSISNRLAQRLLRQRRLSQPLTSEELERKAQEILGTSEASRLELELNKRQFQFLDYARTYWIHHVTELDNVSHEKAWKLFCRCVDGNDVVAYQPWDTAEGQKHRGSSDRYNTASKIVQWSLTHGHNALLLHQALYHSRSITEDTKKNIFHLAAVEGRYRYVEIITQYTENTSETLARALVDAAKEGCTPIILMLEAAGANVNAAIDGRRALQEAAEGGHLEVVERLLAFKADVNAPVAENNRRTALQAAAGGGHLGVVERLLAAKADVNAPATGWVGRTALQAAVEGGYLEVVERLLAAKADVNASAAGWGGRTALQAAAEGGHLKVVERLLAAKADVNTPAAENNGRTALQAAARGGHLKVVERLLAAKADVNAPAAGWGGRTALQAAAKGGHLEVVERLLAAGADINAPAAGWGGRTALQAAAGGGHLEVVERLLAAGADVNAPAAEDNGRTALQAAAEGDHLKIVERLLAFKADINAPAAKNHGRTALKAAAEDGHLEVVKRLLAAKADVNAPAAEDKGRTALQAAAGGGHLEVVERLLAAGADVNTLAARWGGRTALQAAVGGGHLEVVERLLAAGADVNTPADDNGRTALQAAARNGHLKVVERLLAAKADVNAPVANICGRTALQAAAGAGHLEVVERLLAAKADVNAPAAGWGGQTALQAAAEGGHLEVVERLLAAGADVNTPAGRWGGRTALRAAERSGHLEVVERLMDAGARK